MARKGSRKPLAGRVTLVAGATRGAGRGIARALAEGGATVYCTGRSVKGKPSPYGRPETIQETAALIKAAGGTAIALRVDHTVEKEVEALFRRILRDHKRIDVVVDSVAGEDPLLKDYGYLWQTDLKNADAGFRQGLTSRIITAKHAALAMMPAKRGLIVEVTENDIIGGGGNPMAQAIKMAHKTLPLLWAADLAPHRVGVVAVTPGFLRSESVAGRWEEGLEFPAVRIAVLRRTRDRRAGGRPEGAGPHWHAAQLVGTRPRLWVHRLRRTPARLGPAQHRLLRAAEGVDGLVPRRHRSAGEVADDGHGADEAVQEEDPLVSRTRSRPVDQTSAESGESRGPAASLATGRMTDRPEGFERDRGFPQHAADS